MPGERPGAASTAGRLPDRTPQHGFKLEQDQRLLEQFCTYLAQQGASRITIEHAMAWVNLPAKASSQWLRTRLCAVRGFASWLSAIDPATEVPPAGVLPPTRRRIVPYLYSAAETTALIGAAAKLQPRFRAITYQTLIALLAVTGMRIGEAISLDVDDFDTRHGVLRVRGGKFGKNRQIPLHPTTTTALRGYLRQRNRQQPTSPALLVSTRGTRLHYNNFNPTYLALLAEVGIKSRTVTCRPRPHDLRHSFAVATLLDWYRDGGNVQARLPLLSTYLGHVDPKNTYWYQQAAPELLTEAARRLETASAPQR